jgi:hypothetical protein
VSQPVVATWNFEAYDLSDSEILVSHKVQVNRFTSTDAARTI